MTLRKKTYLLIGTAVVLLVMALFLICEAVLLPSFKRLENQSVRQSVEQALKAYQDDLDKLATAASDYAAWDDAYAFIEDSHRDFIEKNLTDSALANLRLNVLAFVHFSGRLVFAKGFNLAQNTAEPPPSSLLTQLTLLHPLLQHPSLESVNKGLLLLPEGPLLIVSHPILDSDYKGPLRGSLLMGRYLNAEEIQSLADVSQLALSGYRNDDPQLPESLKTWNPGSSGQILIRPVNPQTINGTALIHDINGEPAFFLQVTMARDIYQQGKDAIGYFIFLFAGVGLGFGLVAQLLVEKLWKSWQVQQASQECYRAVVEQSTEGIFLVDIETRRLLEANTSLQNMLGYAPTVLSGLTLDDILGHPREEIDLDIRSLLEQGQRWFGERKLRRQDASLVDIEMSMSRIRYGGDCQQGENALCVVAHDISERKRAEENIRRLSRYDSLTHLPNLYLLQDRLQQALLQAQRNKHLVGVLFMDLDRFKAINETLGYQVGDLLLKAVPVRLASHLRASDTLARQSGDEFIIILPNPSHLQDITQVARKLIDLFAQPFSVEGNELYITPSIGISIYPYDGTEVKLLLRNAETAMYHAKQVGKNTYRFYALQMDAAAADRLQLESDLRRALERDELLLYYQPQIELSSGLIIGAEILLRWQHPTLGMVSPARFIPLAEEIGLIIPIGQWVLRTACLQAKSWQTQGFPPLRIAVNLSGKQFKQKELFEIIKGILQETRMSPRSLELELTESTIMENAERNIATLRMLKLMGVQIAVDDFGTGYSSLSYLKNFPIDTLKIDQSFVRGIATNANDAEIIKAIIAMAHSLRLKVLAEGVESEEQLQFLGEQQCDEVQGYYFSRPIPAQEFTGLLSQQGRVLIKQVV